MNIPCRVAIHCEGSDFPLLNTSSERADRLLFAAIIYNPYNPYHPPPIGNGLYIAQDCMGVVYSATSQLEANLMALAAGVICDNPDNPDNPDRPTRICTNDPQTATGFCPDGTEFNYVVPAGLFYAVSAGDELACKAIVNAKALAYAEAHIQENIVCLGSLQRCCCINVSYSHSISVVAGTTDLTWFIIMGSLPPGLTFHGGHNTVGAVLIDGTPTVAGTYNFTVMATTSSGSTALKTYTITVIEITTTALPDYTIGTPYSYQLQAAGGSGNYTWKIESGTLPAGLTMDATGLITGTPT